MVELIIQKSFLFLRVFLNVMEILILWTRFPYYFLIAKFKLIKDQKFFKNFLSKIEGKYENLSLNAIGNYSAQNNKINFKKISINENYVASKEDLKFFKETFEKFSWIKN